MKRIVFLITLCIMAAVSLMAQSEVDCVEVVYFHGKQRCVTCNAIEKLSCEVVTQDFVAKYKEGKVTFRVVDFSTPEGHQIAKQYKVTYSSLFLNKHASGKVTRYNLTRFAFRNAKNRPDEFKKGLKSKIIEILK